MDTPMDDPHEQIRRTMDILLKIFALHPVHAYHPGRHIPLREAVPILSSLNQSHGLTDEQVEKLGYLLANWDRIINDAVSASTAKKKAAEQISTANQTALNLERAQSQGQYLEERRREVNDRWRQGQYPRSNRMDYYVNQIRLEIEQHESQMEILEESFHHEKLMVPRSEQQLEKAEASLEEANREWKALEALMSEINSSLVLG